MISDDELNELAEDIRKHGLIEPITLFENKIIDGRNRYKAAKQAQCCTQELSVQAAGRFAIDVISKGETIAGLLEAKPKRNVGH